MDKGKVIIVGSGLGGLSCGVILAKNGYNVTVLEQGSCVGGCLQTFVRGGVKFETGMHFIGSAAPGQTMNRLMTYLEISDAVELSPLCSDGYDVVSIDGERFRFALGRRAMIDQLSCRFPDQRENLERYYDTIERIANASSLHSLRYAESDDMLVAEYQLRSINDVIDEIITDPLLARVLVGNLPLYAAERGKTPFSVHAFIMDFYNQSAYRVVGGSDIVAGALTATIGRHGGSVETRSKVTRIVCDDTHAIGVEVNGSKFIPCDYVISDAHPIRTLELLDTKLIRPAFRARVNSIPQTVGCFSLYLKFKPGSVPYLNYNYYGYNHPDAPWECEKYTESDWPRGFLYMHMCHQRNPRFAQSGEVLSYMRMSDVERWQGTRVGRRGSDYEEFKRIKAERLLASLEEHFPELRGNIESYYTSTPLTYLDYTGTAYGSMYGNAKDISLGVACRVSHRTRVPNVLQTGQNINSHGMLGVMVGTIVTCSEFIGAKTIYNQIIESCK